MASQTRAVQKEIPTTVRLSAYLKEAKSGIVVAIRIWFLEEEYGFYRSLGDLIRNCIKSQKWVK